MELEKQIEQTLALNINKIGGVCLKFTSPGNAGVPDRVVIHEGRVIFVELKRPGGEPRPLQIAVAKKMKNAGAFVYCISTKEQVRKFIDDLLLHTYYPNMNDYDQI